MSAPILNRSDSSDSSFTSKHSSRETTPASTPSIEKSEDGFDNGKSGTRPLPALQRDFPKPEQDVDVQAMLERQPGRWTVQGQIAANSHRAKTSSAASDEQLRERRAREFEAAKKDLLAFHDKLQPSNGRHF